MSTETGSRTLPHMNHLLKIKQTLKPFKHPDHRYSPDFICKRIHEVHDHLMNYKAEYGQLHDVKKSMVYRIGTYDMPNWLSRILPSLRQYLDVQMHEIKFIVGTQMEPTQTLMVVGPLESNLLAKHYINFIIASVDAFCDVFKSKQLKRAKQIREEIRIGIKSESERMGDIRQLTSDYRTEILELIEVELNELLDSQKWDSRYRMAEFKANLRNQQLSHFLKNKDLNKYYATR